MASGSELSGQPGGATQGAILGLSPADTNPAEHTAHSTNVPPPSDPDGCPPQPSGQASTLTSTSRIKTCDPTGPSNTTRRLTLSAPSPTTRSAAAITTPLRSAPPFPSSGTWAVTGKTTAPTPASGMETLKDSRGSTTTVPNTSDRTATPDPIPIPGTTDSGTSTRSSLEGGEVTRSNPRSSSQDGATRSRERHTNPSLPFSAPPPPPKLPTEAPQAYTSDPYRAVLPENSAPAATSTTCPQSRGTAPDGPSARSSDETPEGRGSEPRSYTATAPPAQATEWTTLDEAPTATNGG